MKTIKNYLIQGIQSQKVWQQFKKSILAMKKTLKQLVINKNLNFLRLNMSTYQILINQIHKLK